MTPFDETALAAALPPDTTITNDAVSITIGGSFTVVDDTSNWTETVKVNKPVVDSNDAPVLDAHGNPTYDATDVPNWPSGVTSPEQALACAYFTSALQQQMGNQYAVAAAAGTLPTWTPGAALPD